MRVSAVAVAVVCLGLSAGGPAMAQSSPSAADIQWAQRTLQNNGYDIGGKVSNRMTPGARRAISEFQSRSGLPATGDLTPATIQALMAIRKPAPTMGVLGETKSSGPLGGGGSGSSAAPPQPRAVPTERIGGSGDGDRPLSSVTLGGGGYSSVGGGPAVRAAPAAPVEAGSSDSESAPQAAPRATVEGDVGAGTSLGTDGAPSLLDGAVPNWARYALWGALGVLGLAMAIAWALSGRKRASFHEQAAGPAMGGRREPVFESGREPLTAGPKPLTAPTRGRR